MRIGSTPTETDECIDSVSVYSVPECLTIASLSKERFGQENYKINLNLTSSKHSKILELQLKLSCPIDLNVEVEFNLFSYLESIYHPTNDYYIIHENLSEYEHQQTIKQRSTQ